MATSKEFIAKLAAACDAVGGVEKKGRNQTQNYDYVKAADIAKAIRHELFERGIVVLQNELEPEYLEYQTKSGTRGLDCRLTVQFIITDGESSMELIAHSQAMDTSDKAIYKAKTGCVKYFLRGLGLIPDEKDDPETDSPDAEFNKQEIVDRKKKELAPEDQDHEWRVRVGKCATVADFNGLFPDATSAPASVKQWIMQKANACGFFYNKSTFAFYDPKDELNQQLEASLQEPQESPTPKGGKQVSFNPPFGESGLGIISKSQMIQIQEARKASGITETGYRNVLGRHGATSSKDLQRANFKAVLDEILDHSKIGV